MAKPPPTRRDRWVTLPHGLPKPRQTTATHASTTSIQVFPWDEDLSSTASLLIEEEYDNSPIDTGLVDSEGYPICRIPWRETVPMGFHYRPEDYEEFYGEYEEEDE